MKHLNKRTFKNWDIQEAAKVLLREGKILSRVDVERGNGVYTGFLVDYKGVYWNTYKHNGEVYSMGWGEDESRHNAYPSNKLGCFLEDLNKEVVNYDSL